MMLLTLANFGEENIIRKVEDTVRVVKLHDDGAIERRIMDMGITKGVHIRKIASFGADNVENEKRCYTKSQVELMTRTSRFIAAHLGERLGLPNMAAWKCQYRKVNYDD